MKLTMLAALISIAAIGNQNAFAEACPNISGVYLLNVNSCQIQGEGSTPALLSEQPRIRDWSASIFPNGIRVYVYPASADNCQYVSLLSNPTQGQAPYLDSISYNEIQGKLPPNLQALVSGQYNGDWDSYKKNEALLNLGLSEGAVQLSNLQQTSDGSLKAQLPGYVDQPSSDNGSFGINVDSTYSAAVIIHKNGDLSVSASMQIKGHKFGVIPVNETNATNCLMQRIQ